MIRKLSGVAPLAVAVRVTVPIPPNTEVGTALSVTPATGATNPTQVIGSNTGTTLLGNGLSCPTKVPGVPGVPGLPVVEV